MIMLLLIQVLKFQQLLEKEEQKEKDDVDDSRDPTLSSLSALPKTTHSLGRRYSQCLFFLLCFRGERLNLHMPDEEQDPARNAYTDKHFLGKAAAADM